METPQASQECHSTTVGCSNTELWNYVQASLDLSSNEIRSGQGCCEFLSHISSCLWAVESFLQVLPSQLSPAFLKINFEFLSVQIATVFAAFPGLFQTEAKQLHKLASHIALWTALLLCLVMCGSCPMTCQRGQCLGNRDTMRWRGRRWLSWGICRSLLNSEGSWKNTTISCNNNNVLGRLECWLFPSIRRLHLWAILNCRLASQLVCHLGKITKKLFLPEVALLLWNRMIFSPHHSFSLCSYFFWNLLQTFLTREAIVTAAANSFKTISKQQSIKKKKEKRFSFLISLVWGISVPFYSIW